jgi:hypothetical protein
LTGAHKQVEVSNQPAGPDFLVAANKSQMSEPEHPEEDLTDGLQHVV